jgi:hypothetical protein
MRKPEERAFFLSKAVVLLSFFLENRSLTFSPSTLCLYRIFYSFFWIIVRPTLAVGLEWRISLLSRYGHIVLFPLPHFTSTVYNTCAHKF